MSEVGKNSSPSSLELISAPVCLSVFSYDLFEELVWYFQVSPKFLRQMSSHCGCLTLLLVEKVLDSAKFTWFVPKGTFSNSATKLAVLRFGYPTVSVPHYGERTQLGSLALVIHD